MHAHWPLLPETVPHIAHPQIRNRSTVGGSLAHADPAAELPVILTALGGRLRLQSATGFRPACANTSACHDELDISTPK